MKKILSIGVSAMLMLSMTACGGGGTASNTGNATTATTATAAATEEAKEVEGNGFKKIVYMVGALGDLSFNDSGQAGMERLRDEHGFTIQTIEAGEDHSKYAGYIREVCEDPDAGYLVTGGTYKEYVEAVASEYPDMRFILFDTSPNVEIASDNILYVSFAQNEGSYLAGMVAAANSKSGAIGAIGGVQNPIICDFIVGYIDGAKAYNPDIKVQTGWVGNWTDSAAMLEICNTQYNSYGVDVFYQIAGGAGTGAFQAAKNIGDVWCIGVDSDQYAIFSAKGNELADVILTSMMKEVGNSFVSIFEDLQNGKEYWGTSRTMGVAEGAVGIADNEKFVENVDAELIKLIEETANKISNDEIDVASYFDFADGATDYDAYVRSVAP